MHFDFTTPKGSLQAMQKRKKWRKENNKRKIKEWRIKKAVIPYNFDIVYSDKKEMSGQGTNS